MNSAIIQTCERIGAVLGLMAVGTCLMLAQPAALTLGVAIGAALTWANLVALRVMVRRALEAAQTEASGRGVYAVLVLMKFALLIGSIFFAVRVVNADSFGVLLGVTAVLSGVIVVSTVMNRHDPSSLDATPAGAGPQTHEVTR